MNKRLPETCRIQYGYAFDSAKFSNSNGIPLIRIRDVVRGYSETFTTEQCAKEYIVNDGDILIGMDGEFNIAHWKGGKAYLNQRVCRLIPTDEVDSLYLFYFMPKALKAIEEKTPFVTVKHLSAKELNKIVVPIPPMEDQKKIANSLQKVDELIALRKEQLVKLDQLVKSRFIELFDGKYETKPLALVCEELFAGGDVKKDKSSDTQSEKYPYPIYTNGEKDNGLYGYTSIVRVAKEAVTISGRGTIGFTCLRKEPFYPAVRLIVAVPKQELISGCYLQHFIQNKNYGGQGASIPQLTVPMIKDEPIPVPPMELQEQFAAFVEQTDKSKLAIQQSLDKLELLKKSLMQEYFG